MSFWNLPIVLYSTKLEVNRLTDTVFENFCSVIFRITDDERSVIHHRQNPSEPS
jgi:hypothetical protein